MRASELFESKLVEDIEAPEGSVVPSATIVPAHIYDMTGKPYPTDSEGRVPAELFQPVKVPVGLEQGMVTPQQAQDLNQWYENGMVPGGGEDYNKNWFITDLAYEVIGSADDLAKALSMGAAIQVDGALKRATTMNLLLGSMGFKTFDDPSKYTTVDVVNSIYDGRDEVFKFFGAEEGFPDFKSWTDQQFKDDQRITAGAVNSWGDLAGLLTGQGWNNIRWQGVVGMIASELPSDLLNIAAMSAAATAGTAASGGNPVVGGAAAAAVNAELSALEAMGFAAFEIDNAVQKLYDDGALQETDQWKNALEIVGGDEDAAVRYVQKSTYAATALRTIGGMDATTMQAVGLTAGTLDAIVDKLVFGGGKIPVPGLRNFAARATVAGVTEGGDEALQQLFINRGLIDGAGAPITETQGLVNAAWQGYIVGKGRSIGADTLRAFGSGGEAIETARAKLRDYMYGADHDPENFENIVDILADAPEIGAMSNYLTDDQGRLNLDRLIDQNMPTFDSLSRQQKRGKGTIEINGEQMRSSEALKLIRANDYARQYFPLLQNSIYNATENEYQATFENGTEALRAARLLGFEPSADFDAEENVDETIEFLEKAVRFDVRVSGRTEFESPNFDTMTAQQRIQFFRDGEVQAGRFKFTREDIIKQSLSDNVPVAQSVLDFVENDVQNVEPRPILPPEIQQLKDRIANSAAMQRAEKELADDQAAWDEEYGDDPENAEVPRPTRDQEEYAALFRQADAIAAPLQSQVNMAESRLRSQQAAWDSANGDTHDADGKVKLRGEILNHMFLGYDDAILRKAREQKRQQERSEEQQVQDAIEDAARDANDVVTAAPDTTLQRANVVYNATMRIASADMNVDSAKAMMESLEKTYPGITKEIMKGFETESGEVDWDRYDQFQQALSTDNQPATPQITVLQPGLQRTIDGETFTWQGTETTIGQWRSDTTGRMASKEQQSRLVTQDEADQIPYIDTGSFVKPTPMTDSPELAVPAEPKDDTPTTGSEIDPVDKPARPADIDVTAKPEDDPEVGEPADKPELPKPDVDTTSPAQPIIDPNDPDFAPTDLPNITTPTTPPAGDAPQDGRLDAQPPEVDVKPIPKPTTPTPDVDTTSPVQPQVDTPSDDTPTTPADDDKPERSPEPTKPEVDTDQDDEPEVDPQEPEDKDDQPDVDTTAPAQPSDAEVDNTTDITPEPEAPVDTQPAPAQPSADTTITPPDVDTTLVTPRIGVKKPVTGGPKKRPGAKVGPDAPKKQQKKEPPKPYLYKYDRPDVEDPLNLMKFQKAGSKLSGTGIG